MTKYKVGDKVRILRDMGYAAENLQVDCVADVVKFDSQHVWLWGEYGGGNREARPFLYDHIEPYTEAQPTTGTLAELNVREGDVVEVVSGPYNSEYIGGIYDIKNGDCGFAAYSRDGGTNSIEHCAWVHHIISRASDAPTVPPSFGELPEVDQLKLQLAHARGSVIESLTYGGEWLENDNPLWTDGGVYRIAEYI